MEPPPGVTFYAQIFCNDFFWKLFYNNNNNNLFLFLFWLHFAIVNYNNTWSVIVYSALKETGIIHSQWHFSLELDRPIKKETNTYTVKNDVNTMKERIQNTGISDVTNCHSSCFFLKCYWMSYTFVHYYCSWLSWWTLREC